MLYVNVSNLDSTSKVTCTFEYNSTAQGCQIVLECNEELYDTSEMENCSFNIIRPDNSYHTASSVAMDCDLKCSTYTLLAFDIYHNGSVGKSPAVMLSNLSITFSTPKVHCVLITFPKDTTG